MVSYKAGHGTAAVAVKLAARLHVPDMTSLRAAAAEAEEELADSRDERPHLKGEPQAAVAAQQAQRDSQWQRQAYQMRAAVNSQGLPATPSPSDSAQATGSSAFS